MTYRFHLSLSKKGRKEGMKRKRKVRKEGRKGQRIFYAKLRSNPFQLDTPQLTLLTLIHKKKTHNTIKRGLLS